MDNLILVDKGALRMALNVLERAGKNEVVQALKDSCREYICEDVIESLQFENGKPVTHQDT